MRLMLVDAGVGDFSFDVVDVVFGYHLEDCNLLSAP